MRKKFFTTPQALLVALSLFVASFSYAAGGQKDFYQIKVYHMASDTQVARVDSFLQEAYLPALHKAGIKNVGVFKPVGNDTATEKLIYVFIPFQSIDQWMKLDGTLDKDAAYDKAGGSYLNATYNKAPYTRIESILLEAFPKMMQYSVPTYSSAKSERVYELRSYEGPTEKLYENKVKMFNDGGEVPLFKRLGFNAVFYAKVLSGCHMPNLMYMTTFENMQSREDHWKAFNDDAEWKTLVAKPEYQHNVSHADIILLHPADYSDI